MIFGPFCPKTLIFGQKHDFLDIAIFDIYLTSLIHINMFQIHLMPYQCKKMHPKITECTVSIGNNVEKVHFSQHHIKKE